MLVGFRQASLTRAEASLSYRVEIWWATQTPTALPRVRQPVGDFSGASPSIRLGKINKPKARAVTLLCGCTLSTQYHGRQTGRDGGAQRWRGNRVRLVSDSVAFSRAPLINETQCRVVDYGTVYSCAIPCPLAPLPTEYSAPRSGLILVGEP